MLFALIFSFGRIIVSNNRTVSSFINLFLLSFYRRATMCCRGAPSVPLADHVLPWRAIGSVGRPCVTVASFPFPS
jgi:hypothetical protein